MAHSPCTPSNLALAAPQQLVLAMRYGMAQSSAQGFSSGNSAAAEFSLGLVAHLYACSCVPACEQQLLLSGLTIKLELLGESLTMPS